MQFTRRCSPTKVNMSAPLVTVIMPAHDASRYIAQSIGSVIGQTFPHWELVVVDDASVDSTRTVVEGFARSDSRVRLIAKPNCEGPAKARNAAIKIARGRYVALLDSDDLWLPRKLERQLTTMERSGAFLSYTAYKKIDAEGRIGDDAISVPPTITYAELLKSNSIPCLTAVYDRHHLGTVFMPENQRREDYSLWLKILKREHFHEDYALWLKILKDLIGQSKRGQHDQVVGLNEVLALYRVHNSSISSNKFRAAIYQWRVYRNIEKLTIVESLYYFAHYTYRGYRKARRF